MIAYAKQTFNRKVGHRNAEKQLNVIAADKNAPAYVRLEACKILLILSGRLAFADSTPAPEAPKQPQESIGEIRIPNLLGTPQR